jgi:hypothetical protein
MEELIDAARKARKEKMEEKKHEMIEMKPEFAKALEVCINFSGTSIQY